MFHRFPRTFKTKSKTHKQTVFYSSYQLKGWGASIFCPSTSRSWTSLKYFSLRVWRISLAWLITGVEKSTNNCTIIVYTHFIFPTSPIGLLPEIKVLFLLYFFFCHCSSYIKDVTLLYYTHILHLKPIKKGKIGINVSIYSRRRKFP